MESATSLLELFDQIEDPRRPQGRRHPLSALLALVVVATLAGMNSLEAISQFGREHGWDLLQALGFRCRRSPSKATLSRVLRRLAPGAFEERIAAWVRAHTKAQDFDQICLDGKTLRGSRQGEVPGVHLLAAYAPQLQAVLAQCRVPKDKGNEYTTALTLLGVLPLKGKVVTADAMFTHHEFCRRVLEKGGGYIVYAKDNQPTLVADLEAAFEPLPEGFSPR
jgi:hypothetical protein